MWEDAKKNGYEIKVLNTINFKKSMHYNPFAYIRSEKNTTGVRITDLERTVIDSIHDYNKIGGFEERLICLQGITFLDESKLLRYLEV